MADILTNCIITINSIFCDVLTDFEKKGKKDICSVLEQFLCHVAKTGQPVWVVDCNNFSHCSLLYAFLKEVKLLSFYAHE